MIIKTIATLFFLFFSCTTVLSQAIVYKDVKEISSVEFNKHLPIPNLLIRPNTQLKSHGRIVLKTPGRTIVLKDDGEMQQYVYMGDLKNSSMALVHELEPNTEEYYFINKRTGTVDTLVGPPVFYPNTMNIVCLEGMNTDVKQRIQVGKIVDGRFRTRFYLRIKGEINPGYVYWADVHTLFLNDNNEKFYKLTF